MTPIHDTSAPSQTPASARRRRNILLGAALAVIAGGTAVAASSAWQTGAMTAGTDSDVHVTVDLSQRKLFLQQDGETVQTFDVAVGKPGHPTPQGNFSIRKIVWNPEWNPPDSKWAQGKKPQPAGAAGNPMKVVKMFLKEPDYYIHGTNDLSSLGEAESHGCVRMHPDDAYALARYLMEHGGAPHDENFFWRVLHFRRETKTVYLGNPVAVTVEQ